MNFLLISGFVCVALTLQGLYNIQCILKTKLFSSCLLFDCDWELSPQMFFQCTSLIGRLAFDFCSYPTKYLSWGQVKVTAFKDFLALALLLLNWFCYKKHDYLKGWKSTPVCQHNGRVVKSLLHCIIHSVLWLRWFELQSWLDIN